MPAVTYRNREAVQIETEHVRVTVLTEGGHVAEILNKQTGVNPLWTPPWPSIEPSTYDAARHPEYGGDSESKLLAGIMGHNLCLDLFGGTSDDEATGLWRCSSKKSKNACRASLLLIGFIAVVISLQ